MTLDNDEQILQKPTWQKYITSKIYTRCILVGHDSKLILQHSK